jgi:pyruvate kinase
VSESVGCRKQICTSADMAAMVARVCEAIAADVTICVTESGSFARHLAGLSVPSRLIAATANQETFNTLVGPYASSENLTKSPQA